MRGLVAAQSLEVGILPCRVLGAGLTPTPVGVVGGLIGQQLVVVPLPLAHAVTIAAAPLPPGVVTLPRTRRESEQRLVGPMSVLARARRLATRSVRSGDPRSSRDLEREPARARSDRDADRGKLAKATAAVDLFRNQNQSLAAELERARAEDAVASGRDRKDLSYLFVVTYGRSGSTLLQGILSSTPGVMIRGENGGALQHLFAFHTTIAGHRGRLVRPQPLPASHPWWGIDGYPDATALRDMRLLMLETVLRPEVDTRVVGFKEITWLPDRLPDYLAFVRDVFPGARFVLNTRDLQQVAQSKWWAGRPDALAELQTMERRYVEALDDLGDEAYHVHYDDWVTDPSALRKLFEWLGENFDEERVRGVMKVRHSY